MMSTDPHHPAEFIKSLHDCTLRGIVVDLEHDTIRMFASLGRAEWEIFYGHDERAMAIRPREPGSLHVEARFDGVAWHRFNGTSHQDHTLLDDVQDDPFTPELFTKTPEITRDGCDRLDDVAQAGTHRLYNVCSIMGMTGIVIARSLTYIPRNAAPDFASL